jgi:NB-ARC domain
MEIADALTKQDIIFLLWTKNGSESDYVKSEWMTARALGKVIKPILFSKDFSSLKLPKPIENVEAIVDLEKVIDIEKNIQKLQYPLDLLRKEKNSFDFKYDYNILPVKHRIPFLPNPDFIGRADELVKLYLDVIGGLNKLNYAHIGIVGMGGVGKTQLAVEFTYRYAFQFEKGVYWIQGADQSKWLSQIIEIAKDLGLEVTEGEEKDRDKENLHAFYDYCKEFGTKVLLIIDNVEDPQSLNNDKILFPSDPSIKFRILELDPWSLYIYAMKAPMTRDRYQTRLAKFLDFIGMLQGGTTLEGRAGAFAKKGKEDSIWALNNILKFVQFQKDRSRFYKQN